MRVLVPSAGGPGCVNLTRSLNLLGDQVFTVGCDASPHYLFLAETDERLIIPRRSDEAAYVRALNDMVREFEIDFIFPNNSLDGELLSRWSGEVAAPCFLPSPSTFAVGANKWETHGKLAAAGLPVPRTWLVHERADLAAPFEEAAGAPVWVRGAGIPGKGVGVASLPAKTVQQAASWIDYWDGWGEMIASEYLPGDNLTWLGVWQEGRLVASQGRERDAYVIPHVSPSGITGAPAISHTVQREDINRLGPEACLAVDPKFTGAAFVDFKGDGKGEPRITEINIGRFGTTHHFYSVAGANFPQLVLHLALGKELPGWVKQYDVLPPDLYWVRTLDAGPALVTADELAQLRESGRIGVVAGS